MTLPFHCKYLKALQERPKRMQSSVCLALKPATRLGVGKQNCAVTPHPGQTNDRRRPWIQLGSFLPHSAASQTWSSIRLSARLNCSFLPLSRIASGRCATQSGQDRSRVRRNGTWERASGRTCHCACRSSGLPTLRSAVAWGQCQPEAKKVHVDSLSGGDVRGVLCHW